MNLRTSWRSFVALFKARNKEFIRDRSALSWAIFFPIVIIIAVSFAFSKEEKVFQIGFLNHDLAEIHEQEDKLLADQYINRKYFDSLEQALDQLGYQRIDLLIDTQSKQFWFNQNSSKSQIAGELLNLKNPEQIFTQHSITGDRLRYVDWVIPGVLGMNMMFGALFGAGYVIVRYRKNGVLKRYQATPITAFEFLTAQVVSRVFIMLATSIGIFIGFKFILDFIVLGSYWLLLLIAILGAFSMVSLGLLLSCRTSSEELAGGLLNLISWPMMLLSEVWFDLDGAPEFMQQLSNMIPLTHIIKAARGVMLDGYGFADIAIHLALLAFMSVSFLAIASSLFRWNKD